MTTPANLKAQLLEFFRQQENWFDTMQTYLTELTTLDTDTLKKRAPEHDRHTQETLQMESRFTLLAQQWKETRGVSEADRKEMRGLSEKAKKRLRELESLYDAIFADIRTRATDINSSLQQLAQGRDKLRHYRHDRLNQGGLFDSKA